MIDDDRTPPNLLSPFGGLAAAKEQADPHPSPKRELVVDIGGTAVKILATGQIKIRSFRSGPTLTLSQMMMKVRRLAAAAILPATDTSSARDA
jgi:hypothetical protein